MASTRDIRRRIVSTQNTRQITRAMEMVAATKMRRAEDAVGAGRDYSDKAREVLSAVSKADPSVKHPLLTRRDVKKRAVVVFSSDRGLAGALNTNTLRGVLKEANRDTTFITVGRKARDSVRRQGHTIIEAFTAIPDRPDYEAIKPIAELVERAFIDGRADEVTMVYPKFVNTLSNHPEQVKLLPAEAPEGDSGQAASQAITLFEPSAEAVLETLLPKLIETQLWQAMLELKASEHSSRMVAMRNATNNASDLIDALRLTYNRARQAAITTEIAEIASAAVA
jgi:F-type H+-transporting ATPase subunit gamma